MALPRIGNGLAERAELRRELIWEGFGMIAPGLFAHPHTQASAAHDILEKLGIPDRALVLSARDLADAGGLPIASLASQCWNLDDVAEQYRAFSKNFGPLEKLLDAPPSPAEAFVIRVLLLHGGAGSSCTIPTCQARCCPTTGQDARRAVLCYWRVFDASEAHLDALAARDNERYTPLTADVAARFGGRPA